MAKHATPLPHCPEIRRKPVRPKDKADQGARDDLAMVAWEIGECGTRRQVARAYEALWEILQETIDQD